MLGSAICAKSTGCASATVFLDSSEASEICKAVGTEGGTVAGKVAGMEVGWSSVGGWLEAGIRGAGRLRASATKYPLCGEYLL